jgi:hypothetical protein
MLWPLNYTLEDVIRNEAKLMKGLEAISKHGDDENGDIKHSVA